MTPLESAKLRLSIPDLARVRGWDWKPGKVCRVPYRKDGHPSGSVFGAGLLFHDFSFGDMLDAPALLARVEGISNEEACKLFIELAGARSSDTSPRSWSGPHNCIQAREELREKPRLPSLALPTREEVQQIAKLRNVSPHSVRVAKLRGFLFVTRWLGALCWALTDRTRWLCQLRRIDGKPFIGCDGLSHKAWTFKGSYGRWPIGCEEAARFDNVALVEGGGDFLAAFHFIFAEGRGADVAPVAMLGSANRIAPEALLFLRSKNVRIFPHIDAPDSRGASPGLEAAARWTQQLEKAGARVTCFDLSGLRKSDETPVKDLNDLTSVHRDDFKNDREQLSHLMDF